MNKIYYSDEEEKQPIIDEQLSKGMYLIEDAVTFDDGKYLKFDTEPLKS